MVFELRIMELIYEISLAAVLALLAVVLFMYSKTDKRQRQILIGLYFGFSTILVMQWSPKVYPGLFYDPRNMLLPLSGFLGGGLSALIAGILAGIFRIHLGGAGVYVGVLCIFWACLFGAIYHELIEKDSKWWSACRLLGFSYAVHLAVTLSQFLLPGSIGPMVLPRIWWLLLLLYPLTLYLLLFVAQKIHSEIRQAQEILRTQVFMQELLSSISEGVISTDRYGKVTYINPSGETLTGWKFEEAKGRLLTEVFQILDEETGKAVPNPVERVLRDGSVVGLGNHTLLRSKNGNIFPIADSAAPILGPQKEILGVVLVFKDQTQERNYLRQIEASERKLSAVFEGVQHGILILTPEGDLLDCNQTALKLFGVEDKKAFINKRPAHFSPERQPDGSLSVEKANQILREVMETNKPKRFEWVHKRVDGTLFPAEVGIVTFKIDQRPLLLTTVRDITERKEAYEALELERKQMLSIFNSIDEIIYVADMDTYEILFVNQKLRNSFGEDPTGKLCFKEFQGREDPCPFCTNPIIRKIKPHSFVWEHYNPVLKRWYYITDRVITWPDGRDVRFELAIDITERKKAEEEKARLEAQLAQAQRLESIGRLAGGIAHDFNNILNIILGRAQLAKQKTKDERIERDLNQIIEASNRATGIISQILSFARKQITNPIPVNLNNLIYQSLKMLGSIVGDNIHIQFKQEKDLWKVLIDPVQLDQILSNLIVNAKDAIQGHGEIVIKTENVKLDENHPEFRKEMLKGEYVMLSVSDTGHGIPEEIQSKIFEPFFTTKEPGKGTGLGLATVYGIVKQNNGYIYVDSRPKEGATFKIFLPKADSDAQSPGQITKPVIDVSFKGKKVVLVEDDKDLLDSLSQMLTLLGFEVEPHISPKEALKELSHLEKRVDLLITDVIMPELNGPELYNLVKDFRPDLKVLFTSGYADMAKEEVNRYKELLLDSPSEGRGFIPKPFTLEDLAQKLKTLLA